MCMIQNIFIKSMMYYLNFVAFSSCIRVFFGAAFYQGHDQQWLRTSQYMSICRILQYQILELLKLPKNTTCIHIHTNIHLFIYVTIFMHMYVSQWSKAFVVILAFLSPCVEFCFNWAIFCILVICLLLYYFLLLYTVQNL